MIHKRHPNLDLTTALFAPNWWRRAGLLFGLLCVLVIIVTLRPSTHVPSAPLRDVAATFEDHLQGIQTAPSDTMVSAALDISHAHSLVANRVMSKTRSQSVIRHVTLARNETLGEAVMRTGVSAAQAFAALKALNTVQRVRAVRPGLKLLLDLKSLDGIEKPQLVRLSLKSDFQSIAQVTLTPDGGYTSELIKLNTTQNTHVAKGTIDASLYIAAEREGLPAATIISLIRALSYRVDFQREIRKGDTFAALYTMNAAADGSLKPGDIDYAELDLGDRIEKLYRFQNPTTKRYDYFDENGESMRRLLMRTPIDGARLTSSFGKRKHPVLGYVRNHQGVDFGAPTGTPIYAAGDGTIERSNRFGSYGNYVLIRHPRGYKTAYAHLSRFAKGMRAGKSVRQGEVIGYVGATGRVTGAHLHYEVYKGSTRVNPMRLDLPTGEVLDGDALRAFKVHKTSIEAALAAEDEAAR